jgi:hypothetical protein
MRVATYAVPAAAGDEDGECAVFFFGQGQGGAVDLNLKRWISQFESGEKTAKTGKRTIHGMNVTTVEVPGSDFWSGSGAGWLRRNRTTGCSVPSSKRPKATCSSSSPARPKR